MGKSVALHRFALLCATVAALITLSAPTALARPTAQEATQQAPEAVVPPAEDSVQPAAAPIPRSSPWPESVYCSELGVQVVGLYDPNNPERAWEDVAAAHGVSFYNPLVRAIRPRGAAFVTALWVNRAMEPDAPSFDTPAALSLDLCNYLDDAWEHGDHGEVNQAMGRLRPLVTQLWCERIRLQAGYAPGTRNPYRLALRDPFGPTGQGIVSIASALARPTMGDSLAASWAEQWGASAAGILRTLDPGQCASES